MTTKDEMRRAMRARRREVSADDRAAASARICAVLAARTDVQSALAAYRTVAAYWATAEEIDLTAFCALAQAAGASVALPRWNGTTYDLAYDRGARRMGPHGIVEPAAADLVAPRDVAVWVVPGLAFTREGVRLGYGGGWYDRFLAAAAPEAVVLGVAYPFQVVDALPLEAHDRRLTAVVTTEEIGA